MQLHLRTLPNCAAKTLRTELHVHQCIYAGHAARKLAAQQERENDSCRSHIVQAVATTVIGDGDLSLNSVASKRLWCCLSVDIKVYLTS